MNRISVWIKEHEGEYPSLSKTLAACKSLPEYPEMNAADAADARAEIDEHLAAQKVTRADLRALNREFDKVLRA